LLDQTLVSDSNVFILHVQLSTTYRSTICGAPYSAARDAHAEFISPHGDPFTLLKVFSRWLQVKEQRHENSRKWCQRMGLEEQRLIEMAKLQRQFQDIINSSGMGSTKNK
jgi:HrpA-like RNA helicase